MGRRPSLYELKPTTDLEQVLAETVELRIAPAGEGGAVNEDKVVDLGLGRAEGHLVFGGRDREARSAFRVRRKVEGAGRR